MPRGKKVEGFAKGNKRGLGNLVKIFKNKSFKDKSFKNKMFRDKILRH